MGSKKELESEDLFQTPPSDKIDFLSIQLEAEWQNEVRRSVKGKPKLEKVILKVFGLTYLKYGIYFFIDQCIIQ